MIEKPKARRTLTVARPKATAQRSPKGSMRIENWMAKPVITVRPHDSVADARRTLEQHRVNQLPVVVNGRLVGIVTDRDLRSASDGMRESGMAARANLIQEDVIPENITVETVMSAKVMKLKPQDAIERAARLMRRERIGGIPVVDGKKLVGIITRADILKAFIALSGKAS
ncbi:MAG: CBS domain-containing protein [Candidatus Binatus sp.]|uniref:CBS domain-containing protein n=1 Tax=Candidatus Binatus sp. TaxID=2811406 RepID=UPI00271B76CA|nr:CBS domain-containing protein [Candidatus Binatus sp.]MDO8433970.1 CBS domain-containing protein [Candidatus Binatus sp.]